MSEPQRGRGNDVKLSTTQQRVIDAAATDELRVNTEWSIWDYWIEGTRPLAAGNVTKRTIQALVDRGLIVKTQKGDRVVVLTDLGRALTTRDSQQTGDPS